MDLEKLILIKCIIYGRSSRKLKFIISDDRAFECKCITNPLSKEFKKYLFVSSKRYKSSVNFLLSFVNKFNF